jgi:hypothetical protein
MVMPKRNKRKSEETKEWQKLSKRDFAISNKICAWNSQTLNAHFFCEIIGTKVQEPLKILKIEFVEQQRSQGHVSSSTWLFLSNNEALEVFKKILENFLEGSETEEVELLESSPLVTDNREAQWGKGKGKGRNSEYGCFPIMSSSIWENTQGQLELVVNLRKFNWFYWDVVINYEIASTILSQILLDETCSVSFNNF